MDKIETQSEKEEGKEEKKRRNCYEKLRNKDVVRKCNCEQMGKDGLNDQKE